jgi:hypothetical protein
VVLLLLFALMNPVVSEGGGPGVSAVAIAHTYEARIRVSGKVSKVTVQASDAGQAKKLVEMQFPGATVLSVKKID